MSNSSSKHRLPLLALIVIVVAFSVTLVKAIREAIFFSSKGQRTNSHAHVSVQGETPFPANCGLLERVKEESRQIIAGHWFNKREKADQYHRTIFSGASSSRGYYDQAGR